MLTQREAGQKQPPALSWAPRLALALASLVLSLGLAELLVSAVHRGAFPYLNLFEADDRYGVRLLADAATRVRSRDGRLTDISTNALGFRGPQWPKKADAPILLLGDSQMFGYGVGFPESIGPQLERATGRNVLVAAVPSWGPAEYVAAISDLAAAHRPRHVLFVANAANDWFETVPNPRRTTATDGWAARAGTVAGQPFPFRGFLMGRSHLVLAIRQLTRHLGSAEVPPADSARLLKRDVAQLRKHKPGDRSPMTASLRAAVEACVPLDCQVIAVALPLDVQVDPAEWKKYRTAPEDLTATEALLEDFVTDARDLGLPAVNLLPVLRAAEPGAFLPDDYHLSPRGHQAAAEAIADVLLSARASNEVNR